VSVEVLEDNGIRIRMSDNGKGLSAERRPVRQLDARLDWSSSQRTALCLEFSRR
jgi:hypothetical protein